MEGHARGAELTPLRRWELGGWVTKAVLDGGRLAAATAGGRLHLGDPAAGAPDAVAAFDSDITDVAAHPDGFAVCLESGAAAVADRAGVIRTRADGVGGWRLTQYGDEYAAIGRNGAVAVLDRDLKPRWSREGDTAWAVAAARGLLVTASTENTVTARSYATGDELWHRGVGLPAYGCADAGDGFVVGTAEGALVHLDDRGEVGRRVRVPAVRAVVAAGNRLFASCADGSLRAYDLGLEPQWTFTTGSWVKDIAVDATTVAVASADHHLYVLDLDGRPLGALRTGHTVLTVARDGRTLLAGSADGGLYILDDVPTTDP